MSNRSREWGDTFNWKMPIVVSASQLETAKDCPRKWWFQKIKKLPVPQRRATVLGEVFHELCERWLLADDQGRDPQGNPIQVFVEGWDSELTPAEAKTAKRLFEAVVEEGILRRSPGRQVEKAFQVDVVPGQSSIVGFVDLWTPFGVEDHKTSKSTRYLQSAKSLPDNMQMMVYAAAWLRDQWAQGKGPEKVELRHNQAITDPQASEVRSASVEIPAPEVADFWDLTIEPLVDKMLNLKKAKHDVKHWPKIPGPTKKDVCRKYGGCPFQGVCSRTESIEAHTSRVNALNQPQKPKDPQMSKDLLAKLAKKRAAGAASAPADPSPVQEASPEPAPVQETPAEEPQVLAVAPWAQEKCNSCGGTGLRDGAPCEVCVSFGGFDLTDYTIEEGEGVFSISRGGVVVAQIVAAEARKPKKGKETAEVKKPAPAEEKKEVAEAPAETKKTRAKKAPATFMVYGTVKRTDHLHCVDMHRLLIKFGDMLADEMGEESYWALDPFKRREALAHKAMDILVAVQDEAPKTKPLCFIVSGDQRDLADLASAIEPFVDTVFRA